MILRKKMPARDFRIFHRYTHINIYLNTYLIQLTIPLIIPKIVEVDVVSVLIRVCH